MHIVTALVAVLLRCLRPARGLHAAPRVLAGELRAEARRRRASRVRRYAADPGTVASAPASPPVPAPRPAPDDARRAPLPPVDPPESLVRGYYLAHEARRQPVGDLLTGPGVLVS
ncbi:hypothetical protein [Nocardiopsis sp. RV163]|uniref:hypothetical protein n=1 Tax=Nocardiopsis sp. RV163 TaxID=1661388 RepID=UPI001F375F45|nr:hypothetical protein [Nocardiopsis sp. RV163]